MAAYYNEIDPYAAQWLRNLIDAGHIAAGDVDERSILDVSPDDLAGYTQCHFFAGIGVWSYALRSAGWPDERPVWTGSCPCQPFSVAGVGSGFDDERHLWPYWFHLIEQRRPVVVFGEQVEAAIRHGWLDLVQADLEGLGYAFAAAGIPAAGVGAPHIRQRLFFVADADHAGLLSCALPNVHSRKESAGPRNGEPERLSSTCKLADAGSQSGQQVPRSALDHEETHGSAGRDWRKSHRNNRHSGDGENLPTRPTDDYWRAADWLQCRDGKWRPVEPGTFPLAHGAPARVGRLRAYGNAIVPQAAAAFVSTFMECQP